jgi:hypothetical protein
MAFYKRASTKGPCPANTESSMTQSINELAQAAIDALAAINAIHKDWIEQLKLKSGHGQYISTRPEIAEHLHIELLEAITDFDCDPMGSLEEAMLYHKDEPDDYDGGRFDYLTSRGV